MPIKPVIIVIEDEQKWLEKIVDIIKTHFDVDLEKISSFTQGEERLIQTESSFDLLITDIFPTALSKERKGLGFVDFTTNILSKPVIVVTGQRDLIKFILSNYKVIDIFEKGEFEKLDFIKAVGKALKISAADKRKKNRGNKLSKGNNKNDLNIG